MFDEFCGVFLVADYTCQALVSTLIFSAFPEDKIVGEEDSSELDTEANKLTKSQIVRLSNEAMEEILSGEEEEACWNDVKKEGKRDEKEWMRIIDRGNSLGGPSGR